MQNKDEGRDLVKRIIDAGLVDGNIDGTITKDGEEIQITRPDNDSVRFDLPGMRKAYVLKSDRLYERKFVLDLSGSEFDEDEPEDKEPPELSVVGVESPPAPQTDLKEEPGGINLPAELGEVGKPKAKPSETETGPSMVQQLDYKGNPEQVDALKFKNRIECECGNIRWVKNADLFQVKKCKPCTYQHRLKRRRKKSRKS